MSYLPAKRTAVVVFATQGPGGKPGTAYASAISNRIGELIVPKQPPAFRSARASLLNAPSIRPPGSGLP